MTSFKINNQNEKNEILPQFTLDLDEANITAVHSDMELQAELINTLMHESGISVFDMKEGLYERLTVEDNIAFYHKWFECKIPIAEVLVLFDLQACVKKVLKKCTRSEQRRVYFAKYYMTNTHPKVFVEPIHGVDIKTTNTFLTLLEQFKKYNIPTLILVSNMEHALLLGNVAYKLNEKGLHEIEVESSDSEPIDEGQAFTPSTVKLFKIPAKVDDKVILFDPLEIDYIESQDGKSMIVINDTSYAMDATLAETEKTLEIYGFFRCHRSYIVNLQKVREIITWSKNTYSLRIDNRVQSTIPLSRTKIQDIQEMFNLK
ncbi:MULTISPECIES: response regulator transcription factor [Bacillaceae]|uniref:LytTR family transcriptional regulator DNA-binding domain-containing protein n=1 Tax=Evansella alkalicola TaxID=745819 RepID=A0ABS6K2J4_9BACI|nr:MULTISPECIES: response regulator transcription factor [Bacillaceae]MBU9724272.1 LytTR family transcriptional regulator DNA-binding domain-containing protein [Bacillus alkalicola]